MKKVTAYHSQYVSKTRREGPLLLFGRHQQASLRIYKHTAESARFDYRKSTH